MEITYRTSKEFTAEQLRELFLSVGWLSANYPERLKKAMNNSDTVISAWDDSELVGLINAIDDGELTAYAHYLLVNPKYQKMGIGKGLVKRLKERYAGYLYLIIISEDKKIVDFYKKSGFEAADKAVAMVITTL